MDFEWPVFLEALPSLAKGMVNTVRIAGWAALFALLLGLVGGLCRVSRRRWLNLPALVYVTIMRAVPVLVTLMFLYYGLPSAGLLLDATTVGVLGLALTSGAYTSEVLRAGIQSIDRGQMRAARALGMSYGLAMRRIVLPQALRRVLPPLTSELITLVKNTALVSTIAISELLRAGTDFMVWKANTFSPFAGVALGYLLLTLPLIGLNAWLERRYAVT